RLHRGAHGDVAVPRGASCSATCGSARLHQQARAGGESGAVASGENPCPNGHANPAGGPERRRGHAMRRFSAVAAATLTMLGLVGIGGPTRAGGQGSLVRNAGVPNTESGWSISPTPNPRAGNGLLNSVSCPTTRVCL